MPDHSEHHGSALSSRAKWAVAVFAIIGGFVLIAEHRAHIIPFLPWLVLLACPLMHLFMHGGHGGHGGHHGGGNRPRGANGGDGVKPEGSWGGDTASKGEAIRNTEGGHE
jgi:hypothetical protein